MVDIFNQLQQVIKGEVSIDPQQLIKFSRDASIFEMMPQIIVFPQNREDIKNLIKFASTNKKNHPHLSLTARAAGTCMSGGTLSNSIVVSMTEHMNKIIKVDVHNKTVTCQPGLFYRILEKELNKHNLLLPPYTSSKRLNTVGGMVANNSGGEKSLQYGKTEKYVEKLKVVLHDGEEYEIKKMTRGELEKRIEKKDTLGNVYKDIFQLLNSNSELIKEKRPKVSKNSAGYTIWDVWDGEHFDAPKLFVGSQGTLGIISEITFKIIPQKKYKGVLMIFMDNFENLPEIVTTVLSHNPDCFESFDHYTMRLALKYVTGFAKILKLTEDETIKAFLPEFARVEKKGMPELTLLIEYEDDELVKTHENLNKLNEEIKQFSNIDTYMTHNEGERNKYWAIRRESFGLLKSKVKGKYAAPFIDDIVVLPENLPEFFPKVYKLLNESKLQYTIAGHIGNGNFHIIPLVSMENSHTAKNIYDVMDKVFELVWEYNGSDSGEHNDGLVRAPYLKKQFGEKIYNIFDKIKTTFDPKNIFNPRKKIGVTKEYAEQFLLKTSEPLKTQKTFDR